MILLKFETFNNKWYFRLFQPFSSSQSTTYIKSNYSHFEYYLDNFLFFIVAYTWLYFVRLHLKGSFFSFSIPNKKKMLRFDDLRMRNALTLFTLANKQTKKMLHSIANVLWYEWKWKATLHCNNVSLVCQKNVAARLKLFYTI